MVALLQKKAFKINNPIVPFIWLTTLATVYELIGSVLLKVNTNYWFQLYSLLEFATLYYFFFRLLGYYYVKTYRVLLSVFAILYLISFLFWSETDKLTSLAINNIYINIFTLVSAFLWFRNLFEKMGVLNLWKHANLYFVAGFFIYYSSTFLLFILSKSLFDNAVYAHDFWLVNVLATLILRILLIIGVWKMQKFLK